MPRQTASNTDDATDRVFKRSVRLRNPDTKEYVHFNKGEEAPEWALTVARGVTTTQERLEADAESRRLTTRRGRTRPAAGEGEAGGDDGSGTPPTE